MSYFRLLLLSLISLSCQSGEDSDTLRVATRSRALSLDPHLVNDAASFRVIENLYSTLMRYDQDYGEIKAHLIEDYTVAENGKKIDFTLRSDVVFHSGKKLDSEDVKYSIERIIRKKVRADHFSGLDKVEILSPSKFRLHFSEPNASILSDLAHPTNAIVDRAVVEELEDKLSHETAGSGAYRLEEWKPGQHLIAVAFEDYFISNEPKSNRILFRPIPDENSRIVALRNKEVDLLLDLPERQVTEIKELKGFEVGESSGTFWEYIGLNTEHPLLKERKLRQAIAYAVDRDKINRLVKENQAIVTGGSPLPDTHWAALEHSPFATRDLEKAKNLLKEVKLAEGPIKLSMILKGDSPNQIEAAQIVKENLSEIGITLELEPLEATLYFERLGTGKFETTLIGWVGFVDPDEWFYHIFHSDGQWNQQKFSHSELDKLLEKGRRTWDKDERAKIYAEVQKIILEESPLVFLLRNPHRAAWRKEVEGFTPHATATSTSLSRTFLKQ